MYLVTIAWMYVVLMMALAEATSPNGTVLGAIVTFFLYGALPLSIVLYVMGSPARRRARRAAEAAEAAEARAQAEADPQAGDLQPEGTAPASGGTPAGADGTRGDPDGRGHAPGDPVAAERKEP